MSEKISLDSSVIYVLLQHGLSVRRDCESGDIYINRSATLKN